MDFDQASLEFLDHFDRPKTADAADFKCVARAESAVADDPTVAMEGRFAPPPQPPRPTRGVCWVLQWAAAVAVLIVATSVLVQFAYLVAAENTLNVAARAGAMEATLPRATYQSVTAVVERRLAGYPQLTDQLQVSLLQNGSPIGRQFRTGDGDSFSITLTAPASAMVPGWLGKLSFLRGDAPLNAHAERQVPGRKLQPRSAKVS